LSVPEYYLRRCRAPEQISLHLTAANIFELHELFFGLNTLGRNVHADRLRKIHDRLNNRKPAAVVRYVASKALVDFHGIEGVFLQVAERRVAHTEIIDSDPYPGLPQRQQVMLGGGIV